MYGYANPHQSHEETIEHLVRRGLLRADTLTIAAPAFEAVIKSSVTNEQQANWQRADQGTAWHALRAPLWGAVVSLFGGLLASKPELGAASALVPTLAAGLPTILKSLLQTMTASAK